jgi:hypothetical protein
LLDVDSLFKPFRDDPRFVDLISSYSFQKKKTGQTWVVDVFPMKVEKEMKRWPEKDRRKRIWCSIEEAVQRITNDELRELVENFPVSSG